MLAVAAVVLNGGGAWGGDQTPPQGETVLQAELAAAAPAEADAEAAAQADAESFFERFRRIPLNEAGDVHLSFGGEMRHRIEAWRNFNFDGDNDDVFLLTRLRLSAEVHLGENIRFFAEGKSALAPFGRDLPGGTRTLDVDQADLQQLYVDLTLPGPDGVSFTLRPGRQALSFGRQRLVSPLPWANTMRTWEGIRGDLEIDTWRISSFWTYFVPVEKYAINRRDRGHQFFGVYATGELFGERLKADLYWLGRDRSALDERRHTLGGRLFGRVDAFDYDLEAAWQLGRLGGADIEAQAVAIELGWRPPHMPLHPRLFVGFDFASGDGNPGAGKARTFDQLFPLGHAYLGHADVVGRQNVLATHGGLSVRPMDELTVTLTGHGFWRARRADALYNAGGAVVRAGDPDAGRFIGAELDLRAIYRLCGHVELLGGYSRLFPGPFIRDTGPSRGLDFFYTQFSLTF